jgi:hypothetical protein
MDVADMAIQVEGAREGQSFCYLFGEAAITYKPQCFSCSALITLQS